MNEVKKDWCERGAWKAGGYGVEPLPLGHREGCVEWNPCTPLGYREGCVEWNPYR